ncbi:MAG: VWA domain-containing protein [Limnospira sp. PMC 1291.21]|uniref:VWFA domain-containing protein n=3 Tax=Limnospira TaxID=2596745 RepID=A0A9P1KHE4_9CYAN|nr:MULTISPECIES: VWA domain-containing protein [Limnospira]EKD07381.1 von Willebrand factor type A [Arthrospira platensis C1]MDC0839601.1 VWA domain-containing protein [Limnoraphis robusta]MDT9185463.1 VWA domain-containing protein [Limnospira sp. PMC 289.06]QJB25719.1 VWA domain-containing protein [Limnospira fusiformis SAG 85.79]RAQ40092.1 VWA domain-containing protein [Arthrospira sp. O9.13F]
MKVSLQPSLNDPNLDPNQESNQRQLSISVSAVPDPFEGQVPMNLCLILDHSGSMNGQPLETVKQAAKELIDRLNVGDRISVVAFDHRAKVLVPNQDLTDPDGIKKKIDGLRCSGGTAIDEGIKLGIEELGKGKQDRISQGFLLTDGENEHGDNKRCLKLAKLATEYKLTINSLGFGDDWNQDILEKIADAGGGALGYIEYPEQAIAEFGRLFTRMQSVGLTNAYLLFSLFPYVRLAQLKPVAQVYPDTIELPILPKGEQLAVRLGDLMKDTERIILANLYVDVGNLPISKQAIAQVQVRYDDPALGIEKLYSQPVLVEANVLGDYRPTSDPKVQKHILALAKYRQTQIAETKLQQGDRAGAATMLQTAAKTALQMGDNSAATVLQGSATRLQSGEELSDSERKKTRIASKTTLK